MTNTVLETLKNRYSSRFYTDEKLTKEEISTLVEAALQAPTARNAKELHITVIPGDHEVLKEIDTEIWQMRGQNPPNNFYYSAPTVMLLSTCENVGFEGIDAGITVENIAIAAESMGLGSLIIGMIRPALNGVNKAAYDKKLQIPEGFTFQIAVAVGHPSKAKAPHDYAEAEQVTYL